MASAIAHFIVGAALALPAIESRTIRGVLPRWAIPISCGALAVAPDLDTFAMRVFGIPYGSFFGHRGFFHSPFFLILLAGSLAAMAAGRRSSRATVWLGLLGGGWAVAHPLLDALTDGGSGVMLLFPFSEGCLYREHRGHPGPHHQRKFLRILAVRVDSGVRAECNLYAGAVGLTGSGENLRPDSARLDGHLRRVITRHVRLLGHERPGDDGRYVPGAVLLHQAHVLVVHERAALDRVDPTKHRTTDGFGTVRMGGNGEAVIVRGTNNGLDLFEGQLRIVAAIALIEYTPGRHDLYQIVAKFVM